jgi:1-phosphofructokinase
MMSESELRGVHHRDEQDQRRAEPKVITVTLNPSLDRTLITRFMALGYQNRVTETSRIDPAGRGVNISRALHSLGIPTHAVILIGHDATGRAYQALLAEEEFPITILRRDGHTRSYIVILDTGHNHETTIREDGEPVTRSDRLMVANTLLEIINPGDTVLFAGSLPPGARTDTYAWLTSLAQTAGAAVAVNAGGGDPLRDSLQAKPSLAYLNQQQLEWLFNFPVRTREDVVYTAKQLREQGAGRVLVALKGMGGALLVAREGVWMAEIPVDADGTQTGLAEALIAGYLAGRYQGRSADDALTYGAAAAAYHLSRVGHQPATARDVEEFLPDIQVVPYEMLGSSGDEPKIDRSPSPRTL